jgi:hypothetical protein
MNRLATAALLVLIRSTAYAVDGRQCRGWIRVVRKLCRFE